MSQSFNQSFILMLTYTLRLLRDNDILRNRFYLKFRTLGEKANQYNNAESPSVRNISRLAYYVEERKALRTDSIAGLSLHSPFGSTHCAGQASFTLHDRDSEHQPHLY